MPKLLTYGSARSLKGKKKTSSYFNGSLQKELQLYQLDIENVLSHGVTNFCFAEKHIENDSLATKAQSHKVLKKLPFFFALET